MKFKHLYKTFFIVMGIDLLLLTGSLYAAHLIRFEFDIPAYFLATFGRILPLILVAKIACFYFFDLYRGMWRYTGIEDLLNVIKAASVSTLLIFFVILIKHQFIGFSRAVFLIDWCLTILLIGGFRMGIRLYFEYFGESGCRPSTFITLARIFKRQFGDAKNLLIIGAGDGGEKIYREIQANAGLRYRVVGFLDDNPAKIGKTIHGVPVLGRINEIRMVADKVGANEALIAIPSANGEQMRTIVAYCKDSGIAFKTIPGYGELINGRVTINSIREVAYRDLLGREVVRLDEERIGAYLNGRTVLVTGAGGSIGAELCRQICRFHPRKLVLLERAESPLYETELELERNWPQIAIAAVLADVQDKNQLIRAFEMHQPQIVFHAAAYKHVPVLELQPWKAIDNNILGTKNLVETVLKFNAQRFVFVSTDKAVRPANVMGASKRVAEMLIQTQNSCQDLSTRFMIVRFGNVVGSVGSVVPLFKKQIAHGGPVTVTHPEVTRFFMTIPEACQLILQAGAMGSGGEIFLLEMGASIKIDDMARDLIRLSGFEPDVDIKIEYIGLRPGEKLYEELMTAGEGIVPTSHEKIMVLRGLDCDLAALRKGIAELADLAENQEGQKIIRKLEKIVPDYSPAKRRYRPPRLARLNSAEGADYDAQNTKPDRTLKISDPGSN